MSDGCFPIILEDWPECKFEGCLHNEKDGCNSALTAMRIENRIITGDFNCKAALVPYKTCDFCGMELVEIEDSLSCPNGCF